MPWADVITDQPGACLVSQAWAKHDVTRLHTKSEVRVKCNTFMHQAIKVTVTVRHYFNLTGLRCISFFLGIIPFYSKVTKLSNGLLKNMSHHANF